MGGVGCISQRRLSFLQTKWISFTGLAKFLGLVYPVNLVNLV
jgi:hypothetical protein